ncbi:zinc ABC transporter substrate-binding protein [Neobacillus sedimentimangrovi]|jgi:zinc transport system substrate-binding protein|uniref:Zinc ABC transporter substrate-binding protein n=1 Tax=Neobacillus sedimentimangrovi TaxID=2699460 RepID=A0ABS8QK23_9BACI|nr:zinc ABC transporter substrate-binding protein [Neobacillus sedimentimangrovi]AIM15991.1 adhesin [Bacillus sp. X1(2014)]MCD4839634.1 zinc ABC transporter substrate-binding protein [Neobacillus sedimentimangrovi]
MKKILFTFILPMVLVLSACSNEKDPSPKKKDQLAIYTTVYPLQYFAERIGGKFVTVETIYPPGADEHTFEPTQKDMIKLADSDLFFYIGLGLEGFAEKAEKSLKNEHVTIVPVTDGLDLPADNHAHEEEEDHHHHGNVNPHIWLDPVYSKELAAVIYDHLVKKMPQKKDDFKKNFEVLVSELDQLNQEFENTISKAKHKKMIVTHAAFSYWETRYGLEQISITGLSTTNEPTQKELEKIISLAEREGIHYMLFEQNVQSKLGKIVQKEIGARALPIHNLGILTKEDIKNKENYFTLMNKNLKTLEKALNES